MRIKIIFYVTAQRIRYKCLVEALNRDEKQEEETKAVYSEKLTLNKKILNQSQSVVERDQIKLLYD